MSFNANPLYSSQWHFNLIGDIETIWAEYSGNGVVVAVYDDGVEDTHEDLVDNYDQSLQLPYDDGNPNGQFDAHGTACAGIIAGSNNGLGGIGVAWGSTITGVDLLGDVQRTLSGDFDETAYITALQDMQNFDIVSNSWGSSGFSELADISDSPFAIQEVNAVGVAAANGRGGLGTIMVKSAGNDAGEGIFFPFTGNPSSQNEGLNVSRHMIAVGATFTDGSTEPYSSWGVNLLISAPAASVTTDLMGTNGYNNGTDDGVDGDPNSGFPTTTDDNYTESFTGTSAAAPVVSGVVALMLEANDELGWRDVQQILAMSASQTGSAFGSAAIFPEDGTWFANGADNWNGGGLTYHINYGYGMVDAFAAVRMAEVWSIMHGPAQTSANEETAFAASGSISALIGSVFPTVTDTITISNAETSEIEIETIYVEVNMTHDFAPDLTILLVAPDGTEFVLHERNGAVPNNPFGSAPTGVEHNGYTYAVAAALGMSNLGDWRLEIIDDSGPANGTLFNWNIQFFGSDPSNDDVYTFTDDFAALYAADNTRVINDTNGGTDWLNFAAVTANVTVDLALFKDFSILGAPFITFGGSTADNIENVAFGDGDDVFLGNALANHVLGARGDDSISGFGGADTLDGGDGNDTLRGNAGNDALIGGKGNDTLDGGSDADTLIGAIGFDELRGGQGNDDLDGGSQADNLFGGTGDDTLQGGGGADRLFGDGNKDEMHGGAGNDVMFGGTGNDTLFGGTEGDRMNGGGGFDTLYGGDGDDEVAGGANADHVHGEAGDDTLLGGNGADRLWGGANDDTLEGGNGTDRLSGDNGNDSLMGQDGNDTLFGGNGQDTLRGGNDNDSMNGGTEADEMYGGGGADSMEGLGGADYMEGGSGADTMYGGNGSDFMEGGAQGDEMRGGSNSDTIRGDAGNDLIFGDLGGDTLYGGTGEDTIYGGNGYDQIWGGADDDTLDGGDTGDDVYGGTGNDLIYGGQGDDWLYGNAGFDTLYGGDTGDSLWGGAQADLLFGEQGNDTLFGENGADTLNGNSGDDTLTGGNGDDVMSGGIDADTFIFDAPGSGHDTITDFSGTSGDGDVIDLTALGLGFYGGQEVSDGYLLTWSDPNSSILLLGIQEADLSFTDDIVFF